MIEQKRKPIGILLTVILISALLTVCLELGLSYLRPDTPGSLTKHLIHFAIMFVLLGGAVLLCLFCPPFKKLWAWIDKNILTKETRPIAIDIIYAVLAGLMLLHHFYVILYYPTIPAGATKFAPFWIVLAALTVFLGKSWREISFRLAAVFLIFTFERIYLRDLVVTGDNSVYFFSGIYAFFICMNVFSVLRPSVRIHFLKALCAVWTLAALALSLLGLYTAWTGIQIHNLAGTTTHVEKGRLWIFAYPTITSSFMSCGCFMAFISFALSKHKPIKILYLFVCLITMVANSLTDTRASFISLACMAAGTLCIGIWTIYRNNKSSKPSGKRTALIIAALVLCFSACFFGTISIQQYLGTRFIEIRDNGGIVVQSAYAEDSVDSETPESAEELPTFEQRNVWFSDEESHNRTLSNRLILWQRSLHFLHRPQILLYGVTIDGYAAYLIGRQDHAHNILLQTALEGGIPALSLFLALIIYGIFHAFRLWNRTGIPFWQRLLPLPMFTILLWEMVECVSHFSFGHPPMTLLWFFTGCTITVRKSLGKATKSPEIPAESAE